MHWSRGLWCGPIPQFKCHGVLDWHHSDYFPLGTTGHYSGRSLSGDFSWSNFEQKMSLLYCLTTQPSLQNPEHPRKIHNSLMQLH